MADQVAVNPATTADAIEEPKVAKKAVSAAKSRATGNPPYSAMVTEAIIELKQKKGSSRHSILQYMLENFEVEKSAAQPLLNRAIKKMSTAGKLVPGALPGRNGAGSFKISAEEAKSIRQAEKAAIKKVALAGMKAQGTAAKKMVAKKGAVKKTGTKVSSVKTAAKSKKVDVMKTGAKATKKVSKVATGAKVKKGSVNPKKAMKKVSKVATGAKVKKGSAKPKKVAKKAGLKK
eukprot:GFUD01006758.1.p1 GENE.GFUD01006758.1~~GFUD01006758.1.p1  ORF type:complete len:233 (-),score=54.85 GFUD01006758.1:103-801(-)